MSPRVGPDAVAFPGPPGGGPVSSTARTRAPRAPGSAPLRRGRRLWLRRDESGQAAEAVIVFPVLLLIIMAVVQFGLWYHAAAVAKAAAAEGVRAARAEGATDSDGASTTSAFLAQAGPTVVRDVQLTVSRDTETARVEIRATAANVIPGLVFPVHALAQSPVERFRAESEGP